jgi:hypothetical protein
MAPAPDTEKVIARRFTPRAAGGPARKICRKM